MPYRLPDLGIFPAVSREDSRLPWLMNWPGTNTTGISACASMDFPLQQAAAVTRTLLTTTLIIISNQDQNSNGIVFTKMAYTGQSYNLFPNTCFSKLDSLFKISKLVVPAACVLGRREASSSCFLKRRFSCCRSSTS